MVLEEISSQGYQFLMVNTNTTTSISIQILEQLFAVFSSQTSWYNHLLVCQHQWSSGSWDLGIEVLRKRKMMKIFNQNRKVKKIFTLYTQIKIYKVTQFMLKTLPTYGVFSFTVPAVRLFILLLQGILEYNIGTTKSYLWSIIRRHLSLMKSYQSFLFRIYI